MNKYVVYLEWPEQCFRVDAAALAHLRTLVPAKSRIVRVRNDEEFLKELPTATHAIVWHFKEEWFAAAKRLRLLATPSAGRELLPSTLSPQPSALSPVIHFGGFHGPAIAESVLGYMLSWCRGILRRPGKKIWERVELGDKCYTLAGTKATILGYGKIGKAIGEKLSGMGVAVKGVSRKNFSELGAAAKSSDWLVCVLPSDTGTDNLVDARLIGKLPPRCVVINVGRGNAIDESALKAALCEGRIAGAILDVVKREPPKKGDTLFSGSIPNLTIMSHSAAFYPDYVKDCFNELSREGLLK